MQHQKTTTSVKYHRNCSAVKYHQKMQMLPTLLAEISAHNPFHTSWSGASPSSSRCQSRSQMAAGEGRQGGSPSAVAAASPCAVLQGKKKLALWRGERGLFCSKLTELQGKSKRLVVLSKFESLDGISRGQKSSPFDAMEPIFP